MALLKLSNRPAPPFADGVISLEVVAARSSEIEQASEIYSDNVLQHRLVQGQVCHQVLELPVLFSSCLSRLNSVTPIFRQTFCMGKPDFACLMAKAICSKAVRHVIQSSFPEARSSHVYYFPAGPVSQEPVTICIRGVIDSETGGR